MCCSFQLDLLIVVYYTFRCKYVVNATEVIELENFFEILKQMPLFASIEDGELEKMLSCLDAKQQKYPKGSSIFIAGDPARHVGAVLQGAAQVVRDDVFGNRTILTKLGVGDLFGEVFACAGVQTLPVSVDAASNCTILLLDYRKIITTCPAACVFHSRLIENMMRILAQKNLMLNQKIEATSARTTREKLLSYLQGQAAQAQSAQFEIPFNRQELADYLSVDRSALSRELGLMRDEGILRYRKNAFELLHL